MIVRFTLGLYTSILRCTQISVTLKCLWTFPSSSLLPPRDPGLTWMIADASRLERLSFFYIIRSKRSRTDVWKVSRDTILYKIKENSLTSYPKIE